MFKTSLFSTVLLFLSCNSTKESTPSIDLISRLENVIFTDSIPHPRGYSEILSEIDSLGLVDAIDDLKRIDSMIFCKWVEPDRLREWISCYYPFYAPMTDELTKTIHSLEMKRDYLLIE